MFNSAFYGSWVAYRENASKELSLIFRSVDFPNLRSDSDQFANQRRPLWVLAACIRRKASFFPDKAK